MVSDSIEIESLIHQIVSQVGRKNNCTFCGVFRRQALDRGALLLGVNKIVTGSFFFVFNQWKENIWIVFDLH
jgi:tRNA(Ile)-lysidine synthase TilS/MesJ